MIVRMLSVTGGMLLTLSAQGADTNPLLGCWSCESGETRMALRFDASHYVIDGEPLDYRLVPGAIQVPEPDGFSNYPYVLNGGALTIHVDDSPPLVCVRRACQVER